MMLITKYVCLLVRSDWHNFPACSARSLIVSICMQYAEVITLMTLAADDVTWGVYTEWLTLLGSVVSRQ